MLLPRSSKSSDTVNLNCGVFCSCSEWNDNSRIRRLKYSADFYSAGTKTQNEWAKPPKQYETKRTHLYLVLGPLCKPLLVMGAS